MRTAATAHAKGNDGQTARAAGFHCHGLRDGPRVDPGFGVQRSGGDLAEIVFYLFDISLILMARRWCRNDCCASKIKWSVHEDFQSHSNHTRCFRSE